MLTSPEVRHGCPERRTWKIHSCFGQLAFALYLLLTSYCNMFLSRSGMDAQVSYAFHSERKLHPEKFKNQLVNQVSC